LAMLTGSTMGQKVTSRHREGKRLSIESAIPFVAALLSTPVHGRA
jgi:hypothetical protein